MSHLPTGLTTNIDFEDYEKHLANLDSLLPKFCKFPVFIGVDANAVVGRDVED